VVFLNAFSAANSQLQPVTLKESPKFGQSTEDTFEFTTGKEKVSENPRAGILQEQKAQGILPITLSNQTIPLADTQAWKFATLLQKRLMNPVDEKVIAVPLSPNPGSQDWNGGVFTYVAPTGEQVRVGRTRNGIDRGGETWVDLSKDGGTTWERKTSITKDDEKAGGKEIASVERPYMYGKMVNGKPWVVLGTCAAEKGTKCWDIHEREAPLAQLERLKEAPVRVALPGNSEYAYKDGVPIQSPDGNGIYMAATRHHIGGKPEAAVNADTVLCRLNEKTGRYEILDLPLPRSARGDMDKTCNRLSSELVFPDESRLWGCDIRNKEEPNASRKNPIQPGKLAQWQLGDFDEITSLAIGTWPADTPTPKITSIGSILGRSQHPQYPTLRYLGIAPLISPAEFAKLAESGLPTDSPQANDTALLITYEKAGATGSKSTYQQSVSKKELVDALKDKKAQLLLDKDPIE
jgi:hypothetical protein